MYNIPADTTILLEYKNARPVTEEQPKELFTLFKENQNGILYHDQEVDFVDFSHQLTIPFKLSQSGPGISVGDVNGDGMEDFYIGGSSYHPGSLFVRDQKGNYTSKPVYTATDYEDMGSVFFDADGDGDLDLYVVSGSVEQMEGSPAYQDRLYVNDGKGNFKLAENALPSFLSSGSCVVAADFDKDGDLDLFVGARSLPGKYPLPASSKILLNESEAGDHPAFVDATEKLLPQLKEIGMISAALWTDFDNDQWLDLMIIGDGIPVTFFKNTRGGFSPEAIKIEESTGFWNSIVTGDFDMDGDTDYVVGNLGQNTLLKASKEEPLNLYAKDIDASGTLDPILFHYVNGKNVPFHTRDEMIEQVYVLRKHFHNYKNYASATYDFFSANDILKDAYHLKYDNLNTSFLENRGNGVFALKAMPVEAQFAPVHGMLVNDFDKDGIPDVLLAGNSYAANIYFGWVNSSVGKLFRGKGDGTFIAVPHSESGFYVNRDVKSVVELVSENKINILVSRTSDSLKVFEYPKEGFFTLPLLDYDAFAEIKFYNGIRKNVSSIMDQAIFLTPPGT